MKQWLFTLPLMAALAALVHAQPQAVVDPGKEYPLTSQAGAWVIVATTYTGPDAANLTRQLVEHLRGKNLPAYAWNFADKKRAEMKADEERWKQEHPDGRAFKKWKIEDEYAVLIGGFADMDSARAYMNNTVKKWPLPPLKLADGKSPYDKYVYYEKGPNGELRPKQEALLSPYRSSFVSRNPAIQAGKVIDPFLKELNAFEDYSLLKCPAQWTLAVQQFGGSKMYVPADKKEDDSPSMFSGFRNALFGSNKPSGETALNGAAMQAHETASVLRKLGFEAYVLHTRHSSIVTIGGFKSAADPAMIKTAERLASLKLDQMHLLRNFYSCEVPRP